MKKEKVFGIIGIICIFIVLFLIIVYTPIINKFRNEGELIISEVMASNIKLPMDIDTLDSLKVEFMNTLKEKGFNANVETMDLEGNIKLIFTIEK